MSRWPTIPLRRIASLRVEPSCENRPLITLEAVGQGTGQLVEAPTTSEPVGQIRFEPGDVLFGKLRPYLAKSWLVEYPCHGSSEFLALVPGPMIAPEYLRYVALSQPWSEHAEVTSYGTKMPRTSWEAIGELSIPLPPLEEQRRIANYLDDQTTRIDQAIQLRQQQLQLVDSRFTALVDDSIGAADEVVPLRYLAQVIIGLTYDPASVCEHSQCPIVVRAGNIQAGALDLETDDLVRVHTALPSKLRLQTGDIVVCARSGSPHLIGKSARVQDDGVGDTWGAFMIVLRSADNDYLRWVLLSSLFQREVGKFRTSTINQLTTNTLKEIGIPFPDSSSRWRIAADLAAEFDRVRQVRQVLLSGLEKLEELRRSMITEVVLAPSVSVEARAFRGR